MDVRRLSSALRAVRHHRGWRQSDVSRAAGVGRSTVARAESMHAASLRLRTIERIATALEIRIDIMPRWRGGELDRVLNTAHAALHEQVATLLGRQQSWQFRPEVSFSIYGERGVIDVVAFHAETGAVLVIEL
jgi:transcriptional regulator with XRE-family HTH domain